MDWRQTILHLAHCQTAMELPAASHQPTIQKSLLGKRKRSVFQVPDPIVSDHRPVPNGTARFAMPVHSLVVKKEDFRLCNQDMEEIGIGLYLIQRGRHISGKHGTLSFSIHDSCVFDKAQMWVRTGTNGHTENRMGRVKQPSLLSSFCSKSTCSLVMLRSGLAGRHHLGKPLLLGFGVLRFRRSHIHTR